MLDREALSDLLLGLKCGVPQQVLPLQRPSRYSTRRVLFEPGHTPPELWIRETPASRVKSAVAGLHLARKADLPVPDCRYIQPSDRHTSVLIHEPVGGIDGLHTIRQDPSRRFDVYRCIGGILKTLRGINVSTWGRTSWDGRRFLPAYQTWREEWEAQILQQIPGNDMLGRLLAVVQRELQNRLPALDTINDFALVHGDLIPANIVLNGNETLGVTSILDWSQACAGDPLIELSSVLLEPDSWSRGAALNEAGYTKDELLQSDTYARLEVYTLTRLLWLARVQGMPMISDGYREAGQIVRMVDLIEEILNDGLRSRIESGYDGGASERPHTDWPKMSLQRAFLNMGLKPSLPAFRTPLFSGALGATLVSSKWPSLANRYLEYADKLIDLLEPRWERAVHPLVDDEENWKREQVMRPLNLLIEQPKNPSIALPICWLMMRALAEFKHGMPPRVLGGLRSHLTALIWAHEHHSKPLDHQGRLFVSLLSCAALIELPQLVQGLPETKALQRIMIVNAKTAYSKLELPDPRKQYDNVSSDVAEWLLDSISVSAEHALLPAYLLAITVISEKDGIEFDPAVLLAATGFLKSD